MLGGTDLLPDGANHSPASELDDSPNRNLKKSARRGLESGFDHIPAAAEESEGEESEGEEAGEGVERADIIEELLESSDGLSETDSSESMSDAGELSTWYTTLLLACIHARAHAHAHGK